MMQENIALAHRWFEEVWNQRRSETIDELVTPDSVTLSPGGAPIRGADEFRQRGFTPFLSAFPNLHVTVEGVVAEGEQVVVRWSASGTHTGDGLGFPPTGKSIFFRGMTWIRFQDGKMMEGWDCWDQTGLLAQLRE